MDKKKVVAKLREILANSDVESDGLINRKISSKHCDEIEVLLQHISLLVTDLQFDAQASKRELFKVRNLLEE